MKHSRESYSRKTKHKNKEYDEGERRRGRPKKEKKNKEHVEKPVEPTPQTSSITKPASLRPPQRIHVKKPVVRTAEEIKLIKEDIARRFKEGLIHGRNKETD